MQTDTPVNQEDPVDEGRHRAHEEDEEFDAAKRNVSFVGSFPTTRVLRGEVHGAAHGRSKFWLQGPNSQRNGMGRLHARPRT